MLSEDAIALPQHVTPIVLQLLQMSHYSANTSLLSEQQLSVNIHTGALTCGNYMSLELDLNKRTQGQHGGGAVSMAIHNCLLILSFRVLCTQH